MAFIPPQISAIDFVITPAYTPPATGSVDFELDLFPEAIVSPEIICSTITESTEIILIVISIETTSTINITSEFFIGISVPSPEVLTSGIVSTDFRLNLLASETQNAILTESVEQMQIQAGVISDVSSTSAFFVGVLIYTPIITNTSTPHSDVQIGIYTPERIVNTSIFSAIQNQIHTSEIVGILSVLSDVFVGVFVVSPEIIVSTYADSDIQNQFNSPCVIATASASGDLQLKISTPEITTAISAGHDNVIFFTTEHADTYYIFTLTGTADGTTDVEIPISSFQCRMRSGDPTYLSVVIPGSEYATDITARANGTLKVEMAYKQDGAYLQREIIVQADLETVAIDEGTDTQSITLTGYKTETFTAKTALLENSIYRSVKSGKIRHRIAKPNIYLKPGDTVTVESDTFTADVISYAISVDSQTMEVAEA